jgi:hypothetical protein
LARQPKPVARPLSAERASRESPPATSDSHLDDVLAMRLEDVVARSISSTRRVMLHG